MKRLYKTFYTLTVVLGALCVAPLGSQGMAEAEGTTTRQSSSSASDNRACCVCLGKPDQLDRKKGSATISQECQDVYWDDLCTQERTFNCTFLQNGTRCFNRENPRELIKDNDGKPSLPNVTDCSEVHIVVEGGSRPTYLDDQRECAIELMALTQEGDLCTQFLGDCKMTNERHKELACNVIRGFQDLAKNGSWNETLTFIFTEDGAPLEGENICVDPGSASYFLKDKGYIKVEITKNGVKITKKGACTDSSCTADVEISLEEFCPSKKGSSSSGDSSSEPPAPSNPGNPSGGSGSLPSDRPENSKGEWIAITSDQCDLCEPIKKGTHKGRKEAEAKGKKITIHNFRTTKEAVEAAYLMFGKRGGLPIIIQR